ncbi:MAG: hypothetical protein M0R03_14575 [Novosphingobium sp.]|nr:hypothetical protein [Novosphingobium sp.]
MKNNIDVTVLLPIHKFDNETIKPMILDSVNSVVDQKVYPKELKLIFPLEVMDEDFNSFIEEIKKPLTDKKIILTLCSNEGETDFCSQINKGVSEVKTKWFSILEFDDVYTNIMFDNFNKYQKDNGEDIGIYLSINMLYDKEGKFLSFNNEIVHSFGFQDIEIDLGFIGNDSLSVYSEYQMTGGIFQTKLYNEHGGLKPSIKVTFWNEFLLRMIGKGVKAFVIPKIGYKHILGREDSISDYIYKNVDVDEMNFWVKTAKSESFCKVDRDIKYNK